jgi:hypothetical protein
LGSTFSLDDGRLAAYAKQEGTCQSESKHMDSLGM